MKEDGAIRFGKINSFDVKLLTKSVAVQVEADEGETNATDSELWGHAPLLYAPVKPSATDAVTGTEHCEAAFMQLGDERVVIATKDRRYQTEVAEGEVILRAMGPASPAYVHLKPDGTVIVKATSINLGGSAAQFVALANLVLARLNVIEAAHNTHVHAVSVPITGPVGTTAGTSAVTVAPITATTTVAAVKTKAQ